MNLLSAYLLGAFLGLALGALVVCGFWSGNEQEMVKSGYIVIKGKAYRVEEVKK